MKRVAHKVSLISDQHFGSKVPPHHFGYFLSEIPIVVQQAISMALRNRSSLQGRRPSWLDRAADIRFVGHEGNGSTDLFFEAPTLGDSARELYAQSELWPSRPDQLDTGFDVLGDVLADVADTNSDSVQFDAGLLRRLVRFRHVFDGPFTEIEFVSRRFPAAHPAKLAPSTIATAKSLLGRTPPSNRVRVVGVLDMIRISTQSIAVRVDSGEEVRGVLPEGEFEALKGLLNQRVLILGTAVYRASGKVLRIDVEEIRLGEKEASIWSRVPRPGTANLDTDRLRRPQGPRSGMAAIMGHWPGDESDEQIASALEQLS